MYAWLTNERLNNLNNWHIRSVYFKFLDVFLSVMSFLGLALRCSSIEYNFTEYMYTSYRPCLDSFVWISVAHGLFSFSHSQIYQVRHNRQNEMVLRVRMVCFGDLLHAVTSGCLAHSCTLQIQYKHIFEASQLHRHWVQSSICIINGQTANSSNTNVRSYLLHAAVGFSPQQRNQFEYSYCATDKITGMMFVRFTMRAVLLLHLYAFDS